MPLQLQPSCTTELPAVDETLQVGPDCGGNTIYSNTEQSYTANCPEGLTGSPVTVTIPAGTYTSAISQEDADNQALAAATEQAQAALECLGEPPVLDINIASSPSNIVLDWTQETDPGSNEVWRNIDGATFTLIATLSGALTTYSDTDGISGGEIRCYKVRGVTGESETNFSNIWCAVRDMLFPGAGVVAFPSWRIAFGDFGGDDPLNVTSLDLSGLKRVTGSLYLDSSFILETLNLDALQVVNGALHLEGSDALTSLSLPALTTIGGGDLVEVQWNGITPTMVRPALVCDGCEALETVSVPNLIFENDKSYLFDSCGLSVASVEHILARAVASGVIHAFITLDGGTNAGLASLSAGAQTDYAALLSAGNSISINV